MMKDLIIEEQLVMKNLIGSAIPCGVISDQWGGGNQLG